MVGVLIEGVPVQMELNTGAAVSLLPFSVYQEKFRHILLQKASTRLRTYTGEKISPKGEVVVKVQKNGEYARLPLIVVDGRRPPLLGRNWLASISVNWHDIKAVRVVDERRMEESLEALKIKYPQPWRDCLGKVSGIKAKVILKEVAQPVFLKARPIPYSLREKVERELDRLQKDGVISRVDWNDWATPIVVVPKPNGTIRLCGDFKMTINPVLKVDQYPLPKMDDIFAALGKGVLFSKIDLQLAYLQMELDEESRGLLTVNTHKGLFQFNRMAFGVASAPAIWQRTMDTILQGIPNVQCFLDDIVAAGGNMEEQLHLLETVLKRLEQYGLTINKKKSIFFQRQIEFCGHVIDAQGLHKTTEKIQAIVESPKPMNVSQLRSFLGMVNYYRKFHPNLSTKLAPLHALLQKDVKWSWTKACEEAWKLVKDVVTADTVLAHFDPSKTVHAKKLWVPSRLCYLSKRSSLSREYNNPPLVCNCSPSFTRNTPK